MAHPVIEGLLILACVTIIIPMVYNYNVETMKMASDYHEETKKNMEEGRTWSQHFWSLALGGFVATLFRYFGTVLRLLKSYFLLVLKSWVWVLGLVLGLGLQPKRCSYCLSLGAGEGVCHKGGKVWVCKTCR